MTEPTQLSVFAQPDLPPALRWQAVAFMRVEWPFVFRGEGRLAADTYPPELGTVHFAAHAGDALLSYAAAIRTPVEHAGARYDAWGFGNMFTFPPYRREGLGRRVLALAGGHMRASGADLALLFCDARLAPFYAAEGWEPLPPRALVGPEGTRHEHEALTMLLPISARGLAARPALAAEPLRVGEAG